MRELKTLSHKIFWIEPKEGAVFSYQDLADNILRTRICDLNISVTKTFELYSFIIKSIICNISIKLENRLDNVAITPLSTINDELTSFDIERFFRSPSVNPVWELHLQTSGTTGRPKDISHHFTTLTRSVKLGAKWSDDVWGFAFWPSHFAGLQVFFQGVLNLNTFVNLNSLNSVETYDAINKYKVNCISATPTYFRTRILSDNKIFNGVRSVTIGGERSDRKLIGAVSEAFPLAKIRNVYASTEGGSLFSGNGDVFEIPNSIRDQIIISPLNELLLHRSLLANSASITLDGDWYNTGDIVEVIEGNTFRFIGRKSEMINVGGYKVDPAEIESAILQFEEVIDVVVRSRPNAVTGEIPVAFVVLKKDLSLSPDIIEDRLIKTLSPWKIPRIIKIVSSLEETFSGKRKRI